ncbi:MAG: hypothetical protein KF708_03520 [Pirellulales bacterium]|nr:hypothetical protein [Pirellulales bacterium]
MRVSRWSMWVLSTLLLAVGLSLVSADAADSPGSAGKTYRLVSSRTKGETTHVETLLEVAGDLSLVESEKVAKLPLVVNAKLVYDEKLIDGAPNSLASLRALRHYTQANADIKIEKGSVHPELRGERRLIGVAMGKSGATVFSPDGPLLREELDLIDVQGNSLAIEAILPTAPVSQGQRWPQSAESLALLLGLEATSATDVESLLVDVSDNAAKVELSGTVHGAIHGVASEIELRAKYKFDLGIGRITWFAMAIKERRSIGHVDPGIDVVAKLQMKLTPGVTSASLEPAALKLTNQSFTNIDTRLSHESFGGNYGVLYDRRWFIMNDEGKSTVFRYIDRGELIAQCNISVPAQNGPQNVPSLEKFQHEIEQSLGSHFGQFVRASEGHDPLGRRLLRVDATGTASELPIQWSYVHVTDETGNQAVLLFTVEEALVERFGEAGKRLADTVYFLKAFDNLPEPTPAGATAAQENAPASPAGPPLPGQSTK